MFIANEDGPDNEDEDEQQTPAPDNQTLLRLLEHHEKVRPRDTYEIDFLNDGTLT